MYALSAPEFFRKAYRLRFYAGALRHRIKLELQRQDAEPEPAELAPAIAGDPDLFGIVEFG